MVETKYSLREQLKDKDITPEKRREIREKLIKIIKKKGIVKLSNGQPAEYQITYDTFGQTLEPVYFWVLDYLRNSGPSGIGFQLTPTWSIDTCLLPTSRVSTQPQPG